MAVEAELRRELVPCHSLHAVAAVAVGRSAASDDVLFRLLNAEHEYALVHLTWAGRPERSEKWPYTELYKTWHDFLTQRMQQDQLEYKE
ncbi:hypothetical protein MUN84_09460 [Hymenobacter sp. 5516J-16]|uniref:hypothetical protein n=1 Tax=Hymenobacter sp. 5516J-16 TaxID=2932253 RepID=UPI001FD596CC|nr:hypothetical protein [Hymenobacter sp. 5516J-16]UOQ78732.1 hypothetical protein MUN84_09460 [Hymenobacter sp. 5516J-16]